MSKIKSLLTLCSHLILLNSRVLTRFWPQQDKNFGRRAPLMRFTRSVMVKIS